MLRDILKQSRLLIVDDQPGNVLLLERMLRQIGYHQIAGFTDPRKALAAFETFRPDLVALDLRMPHMDGFAFLREVRARVPEGAFVPILILTADRSQTAERDSLALGAKDFLTKPLDLNEVGLRIYNLLETRWLHVRLRQNNQTLENRVEERTRELKEAQFEIIRRLALASEFRDDDTGQHTQRVGALAALVGRTVGLPAAQVELLYHAAPLHDVGKIGIPDSILLKPGVLTIEERELVKRHTEFGARILSGSRFPILQMAERIAMYHHERWDGRGYYGLGEEDIPLEARIVTLVDTFDVITHSRPYKKEQTAHTALAEIESEKGRQFDPRLVEALQGLDPLGDLQRLAAAVDHQGVVRLTEKHVGS